MSRVVTSHSNATVKAVKALHMRKTREETGQFLAEILANNRSSQAPVKKSAPAKKTAAVKKN